MESMKCPQCGKEMKGNEKFCSNCGSRWEQAAGNLTEEAVNEGGAPFQTAAPGGKKKLSKNALVGIIIAAVAAVVVIILAVTLGGRVNFKEIEEKFGGGIYSMVADDGSYLIIDTNPYDMENSFNYDAWTMIQNVNKELGFPEAVEQKMNNTSAMDGRQTQSVDGVKVSWTYHPDNGLEVMYEIDD